MTSDSSDRLRYLPVGLDVRGKSCIVVGGGPVGTRKVHTLLRAGASVSVISPTVTEDLAAAIEADRARWVKDSFQDEHLGDAFLVIAATDDKDLNAAIIQAAADRGALVCDASSAERSQVIFGALHTNEDATIAVFTDGRDPSHARRTRDRIADLLRKESCPERELHMPDDNQSKAMGDALRVILDLGEHLRISELRADVDRAMNGWQRRLEELSQESPDAFQPYLRGSLRPVELIQGICGSFGPPFPAEVHTLEDPPPRGRPSGAHGGEELDVLPNGNRELIEIDDLPGLYTPEQCLITIYTRRIREAAERLDIDDPTRLEEVVRLHEAAHAFVHIGTPWIPDNRDSFLQARTANWHTIEPDAHEVLAQLITWVTIQVCSQDDELASAFLTLIRGAPEPYQLDELERYFPADRLSSLIGLYWIQGEFAQGELGSMLRTYDGLRSIIRVLAPSGKSDSAT